MNSIAYFLDKNSFEIKDVIQIKNYQTNLDEETNAKSSITVVGNINTKDKDIVLIKENGITVFMGIIESPTTKDEGILYEINTKYITNLFDRELILKNSGLIKEQGIEDFIAYTIENEFLNSDDVLLNINYIDIEVLTHTPKKFSVSTDNGIYNFHTFITNCTQNYNIVYDFAIKNKRLKITIKNIEKEKSIIIDSRTTDIINYKETFATNVIAKVTVLCANRQEYNYFLLNNKTITEDKNAENRAIGDIKTIYEEEEENARQSALNVFKGNSYSHLIQFDINKNSKLYDVQDWKIGTLVKIKNKKGEIIDTYISAITKNKDNPMYTIKTGNIRINFLDKLKKEKEGKK